MACDGGAVYWLLAVHCTPALLLSCGVDEIRLLGRAASPKRLMATAFGVLSLLYCEP